VHGILVLFALFYGRNVTGEQDCSSHLSDVAVCKFVCLVFYCTAGRLPVSSHCLKDFFFSILET